MIVFQEKFAALILLGLLFCLSACLRVGPSTSKGRGKFYESFYVGEQGMQYFFKPVTFENPAGNQLSLDISFRHREYFIDSAVVNFSILGEDVFKQLSTLEIRSAGGVVLLEKPKLLFVEKENNVVESRFTSKADSETLSQVFESPEWQIEARLSDRQLIFYPDNKASKAINVFYENIFSIL